MTLRVANVLPYTVLKIFSFQDRHENKDAYDLVFTLLNQDAGRAQRELRPPQAQSLDIPRSTKPSPCSAKDSPTSPRTGQPPTRPSWPPPTTRTRTPGSAVKQPPPSARSSTASRREARHRRRHLEPKRRTSRLPKGGPRHAT